MGNLIALEGIDGSGKSTQARALCARIARGGVAAEVFREPGDSEFGDRLRDQFRNGRTVTPEEEMQLFLEDRRIDVRENILPALDRGAVVMDRYYFSSMAYQGALGLDVDEIRTANEAFAPRPALTLILDVPPGTSALRIEARNGEPDAYEGVEYLGRVRALFLSFVNDVDVMTIDATGSQEAVEQAIWDAVEELFAVQPGSSA